MTVDPRTPITEQDLVDFLYEHDIETLEDLKEFSKFVYVVHQHFWPAYLVAMSKLH